MNLWVNRIGQLAVLAVALFFFACEDEASLLGYKNPTTKFNIKYIDIPVETSVILLDSVRTSNFDISTERNRLLVGRYVDPQFGEITATAFAEFYPSGIIRIDSIKQADNSYVKDMPVFDSVAIMLKHDFYAYGASGTGEQKIHVHELNERLVSGYTVSKTNNTGGQHKPYESVYAKPKLYFNKTAIAYNPTSLGSESFNVNLEEFKDNLEEGDESAWRNFALDPAFGKRIFDLSISEQTVSKPDSFRLRSFFNKHFKGVALVSEGGDKIIGYDPAEDSTKIIIHYHNTTDTLKLELTFNNMVSFNNIVANRGGTQLAGLNNYFEETDLGTDLRYVQSGTGIVTKLDFSKFNELADDGSIGRMAINSAEFLIKNIEEPGTYTPPQSLLVRLIKDNNRPKKLSWPGSSGAFDKDRNALSAYRGQINFNTEGYSLYSYNISGGASRVPFDSTLNIVNDFGGFLSLNYSSDTKSYKGSLGALFFQQLFLINKEEQPRFTKAILYPYSPKILAADPTTGREIYGKTLERVAFNKNNIVLRIYYTVPTANQNQ